MKRAPTDEAIAALRALTPAQRLRTWADEIVAYNERLGVRAPAYVEDVLEVLAELERASSEATTSPS